MMNFARYFFRGIKNTLRVQNGVNFSYKGPWVGIIENTVIDEWYVGDFCAADYTIVVDVGNLKKEIIKCLLVAGPEKVAINVYGRTSLSENLIDLSATVNSSKVQLLAGPTFSPDGSTYDNSSLLVGSKLIFSANYYYTINDLVQD
jgi:hypothetical protein